MIELNKINNEKIILNCNLIETIESIPETKINLTTGKYYLVTQTKEEVVNLVIDYNKKVYNNLLRINEV